MVAPEDLASEEKRRNDLRRRMEYLTTEGEWRTYPQRKNRGPDHRRRTKDWTIVGEIIEFIQKQEVSSLIYLIR